MFRAEHEEFIRGFDQSGGVVGVVWENRQAGADSERAAAGGTESGEFGVGHEPFETLENLQRCLGRPRTGGRFGIARLARTLFVPEDDGEFISADPCYQIVIADASTHEGRGLNENFIADAMAVFVVVFLEVVDVEKQQRDGKTQTPPAFDDAGEKMPEVAGIVRAGQLVGDREFLQSVVPVLQPGQFSEQERELSERMANRGLVFRAVENQMQCPGRLGSEPQVMRNDFPIGRRVPELLPHAANVEARETVQAGR